MKELDCFRNLNIQREKQIKELKRTKSLQWKQKVSIVDPESFVRNFLNKRKHSRLKPNTQRLMPCTKNSSKELL